MKTHASKYLHAGLCVLPAIKAEKRPAIGKRWKQYQRHLPTEAEAGAWFSNSHDAICIVTGVVSGNLEMIDFDHNAVLFEPWAEFIRDNRPGLLDKLTIETTQRGGRHIIYRCEVPVSGNLKLARRKINDKPETLIETRGEGGLFLCYPTPGYVLIQGDLESLPVLTEDERAMLLMAAAHLNEVDPEPRQSPPHSGQQYDGRPGDDYNSRADVREILRTHGWTYLGADSVNEKWRRPGKDKGSLSATLRIEDQRLYVFSSNAAPFESGKTYLPFAVLTLLEYQGDYERAASQLARQGYGQLQSPQEVHGTNISGIVNQAHEKSKPEPSHATESPQPRDSSDPGLIPDDYYYEVPGFVRAYMEHCVETMPYKRPGMAFCGAISCLSWLTGRKVKSPSGIRTNIYALGIVGSGGGKDWARKINSDIFDYVGALECLGKDFASGEGLEDKMAQSLCMLFQNDEIDTMLQCMKLNRDGRYERLISYLLQFYTTSDSSLQTRAKAGKESGGIIRQPHLSIFGTATPENFYGAFNERMLTNGLFPRMMIFDLGDDRGKFHQPGDRENLPESIKEAAMFWNEKAFSCKGNLLWENPKPVTVPYSGDTLKILKAFQDEADACITSAKDPVIKVAWTRAGENARKLALLYACSEDHKNPQITETAARWAKKLIKHQITRQLYMINIYYAESPFHKLCQKTLERLRRAKGGAMPRGKLLKTLKIKSRELDEIIDTLIEQEDIVIEPGVSGTFKGVIYRYVST